MAMLRRVLFLSAFLAVTIGPPVTWAKEPVVELEGLIQPSLVVSVGCAVPGVLDAVKVDRGDLVEKGQVVAWLESGVERAAVDLAEAHAKMKGLVEAKRSRLDFMERKEGRHEELYSTGLVSAAEKVEVDSGKLAAQGDLRDALENRDLAALELNQAKEILNRRIVRSPIRGVVMERMRYAGEHVEDQPILKIAQIDPLYVEVIAPASLYGKIRVGAKAEVLPERPMSVSYVGRIKVVDRVIDAASGSFGIRVEIANPRFEIPAGLKCRVRFPR